MLQIYLTGSNNPNEYQNFPSLSTGGYISTCKALNDELDGLINGVSEFGKIIPKTEYALIAVKNEASSEKRNLTVSVLQNDGAAVLVRIGAVRPSKDEDGEIVFEKLIDRFSKPMYCDFDEKNEGIMVGNLAPKEYIGIWIRRDVAPAAIIQKTDEELESEFLGHQMKVDVTELVFNYD